MEWRDEDGRRHRPAEAVLRESWVALAPPVTLTAGQELALRVRADYPPMAEYSFRQIDGEVDHHRLNARPPAVSLMGPQPAHMIHTFQAKPTHAMTIVRLNRVVERVENGTVIRRWYLRSGGTLHFERPAVR